MATSFYNDSANEEIGEDLVKLLLESKQIVPDFLSRFVPEGELNFNDDTDDEDNQDEAGGAEGGWGDAAPTAADGPSTVEDWTVAAVGPAATLADSGWAPEAPQEDYSAGQSW